MNVSQLSNVIRPPSSDVHRPDGGLVGTRFDPSILGPSSARERSQVEWLANRINGDIARDPSGFRDAVQLALGAKADGSTINALIDAARADAFPVPPVRFVESGALGPNAASAWDGKTMYLDRSLMDDSVRLEKVFAEELGYSIGARLSGNNASGYQRGVADRSSPGSVHTDVLEQYSSGNHLGFVNRYDLGIDVGSILRPSVETNPISWPVSPMGPDGRQNGEPFYIVTVTGPGSAEWTIIPDPGRPVNTEAEQEALDLTPAGGIINFLDNHTLGYDYDNATYEPVSFPWDGVPRGGTVSDRYGVEWTSLGGGRAYTLYPDNGGAIIMERPRDGVVKVTNIGEIRADGTRVFESTWYDDRGQITNKDKGLGRYDFDQVPSPPPPSNVNGRPDGGGRDDEEPWDLTGTPPGPTEPGGPDESPEVDNVGEGDESDRVDESDEPDASDQVDEPDEPSQVDEPDEPDQVDEPDEPSQVDEPDEPDQVDEPDEPEDTPEIIHA